MTDRGQHQILCTHTVYVYIFCVFDSCKFWGVANTKTSQNPVIVGIQNFGSPFFLLPLVCCFEVPVVFQASGYAD